MIYAGEEIDQSSLETEHSPACGYTTDSPADLCCHELPLEGKDLFRMQKSNPDSEHASAAVRE